MVIPQTLKSGTFEFALSKNQIFVMGADVKPIKLEFIGDTRTVEYGSQQTNDLTEGSTDSDPDWHGYASTSLFWRFQFCLIDKVIYSLNIV